MNIEFKKIPMMRPGIDHMANAYTYDKVAYEKCFNNEVFQTALKEGKCLLFPYNLWEEADDSKFNDLTVYGYYYYSELNIGHIVSIDRKNNTCDISIRDDTEKGKKAIEALEDKDNTFVYIGVNSIGKIKSLNKKIFEPEVFTTFMLVTVPKDDMDYKNNLASYPVENTYYADINNK